MNLKYYNPDRTCNVGKVVKAVEQIHKVFRSLYDVESLKVALVKDTMQGGNELEHLLMKIEIKLIDLSEDLKGHHPDQDDKAFASNFE